jgi:hypothetical protein
MASGVSTRDEAVAALHTAIGRWRSDVRGVIQQATAVASGFQSQAAGVVRQRKAKLGALQAALMALGPEGDPAPLLRQVAAAEVALSRAMRANALADEVEREVRGLQRRTIEATEGHAASAERDLARRLGSLSGYREASVSTATGNGSSVGRVSSDDTTDPSREEQALRDRDLESVALSATSHADNPVIDGYHKGGTTRSDYRWAVESWATVVQPGIAAGATREDFERRDAARGATGFRRSAGVYDMFLGSERLVFSRRPDGSLDVTNGRHRIDVARELGITHLPGEIR